MTEDWRQLISRIHTAPLQAVVVVTGGGATAISDLLSVPGGSRTILEAVVPYSAAALGDWLGKTPEHFCSEETALAMAAVAYERGSLLSAGSPPVKPPDFAVPEPEVVGLSCTAALVSDRPKKGEHRCFIAVQGADFTVSLALTLEKGARDRPGEEQLVSQLILTALARAADVDSVPPLPLRPAEQVTTEQAAAHWLLLELRSRTRGVVWSLPTGDLSPAVVNPASSIFQPPRGVLCGAFNPLHYGHEQLRRAAEQILGGPVYYELSIKNVDKPPLDFLTIERRRAQFKTHPLALTVAPTFAEKADALPGVTFVVGVDTAERIVEPRYYADSQTRMRQALSHLRERGCRFLVAGRMEGETFRTLDDVQVPAEFADLFAGIPADMFRADVSSTDLRRRDSGTDHD